MAEYIVDDVTYSYYIRQNVVGELIRCKDCKKWRKHYTDCTRFRCDLTDSEDFCSWAERREE